MSLGISWKEILTGTAVGIHQLSTIDTGDIRSAWVKRAVGTVLYLQGKPEALKNAYRRGSIVIDWGGPRERLTPETAAMCESILNKYMPVSSRQEAVLVRTIHGEYRRLTNLAHELDDQEFNELIRRLVSGITSPVIC